MNARGLLGTTAVCLALSAAPARAQVPPRADADASIDEGIRLRAERRDAEALTAFRRAWEATHGAEPRAQIGLAEQALGEWADAERDLVAALARADDPWVTRHRADLEAALSEIRRHLGSLEVRCATPGARVRVNASAAVALPLSAPLRVVTGTSHVEVTSEGYTPVRREVEVRPGDDLLETFELVAVSSPTHQDRTEILARPPADLSASPMRVWGTRLLIAGGGLVALGAASIVWREVAAGEFNAPRDPPCETAAPTGDYGGPLCVSLYRQASVAEALAVAGLVVGGVALAGGIALRIAAPTASGRASVTCAPGLRSLHCAVAF